VALAKGPVKQATFSFNLSRNVVALQVETVVARITIAYRVRDQLISQQNIVLRICGILGV